MSDLRPRGLNHVAYVTTDTSKTKNFYTQVLKMRLVGYAREETVGSTGVATSFLHTFFEMGDSTCVAFFEIEGVEIDHHESALPRWAPHLALSVNSREELDEMHQRVLGAGLEVGASSSTRASGRRSTSSTPTVCGWRSPTRTASSPTRTPPRPRRPSASG